jgi:hypothetical protein
MEFQKRNLLDAMQEVATAVDAEVTEKTGALDEGGESDSVSVSSKRTKRNTKLTVQSNFGPWSPDWVQRSRACEYKGMCDCEMCIPEVRVSNDEFIFEHTFYGCENIFRCAPPVPRVRGLSPPSNRYCRCLAVGNDFDWFCSNRCFWVVNGVSRRY